MMGGCVGGKMKNNFLFNSPQEISYRIVLLLSICNRAKLSVDRLASLDFISVYGSDFGISENNLHGNNQLRFSEYTSRRGLIKEAINKLVVLGLVKFYPQHSGFLYGISTEGIQIASEFNDSYADQYKKNATKAYSFAQKYSDRKLAQLISEYSVRIAKEE